MPVAPPQLPSLQAAVKLHMAEMMCCCTAFPHPTAPTLVLTWVCQQMQAWGAALLLLPGHAHAYPQTQYWC